MSTDTDPRWRLAHAIRVGLQNHDAMREIIRLQLDVNTSGCPMLRVDLGPGQKFNVTITKSRA